MAPARLPPPDWQEEAAEPQQRRQTRASPAAGPWPAAARLGQGEHDSDRDIHVGHRDGGSSGGGAGAAMPCECAVTVRDQLAGSGSLPVAATAMGAARAELLVSGRLMEMRSRIAFHSKGSARAVDCALPLRGCGEAGRRLGKGRPLLREGHLAQTRIQGLGLKSLDRPGARVLTPARAAGAEAPSRCFANRPLVVGPGSSRPQPTRMERNGRRHHKG